jgi:hypothetical protein
VIISSTFAHVIFVPAGTEAGAPPGIPKGDITPLDLSALIFGHRRIHIIRPTKHPTRKVTHLSVSVTRNKLLGDPVTTPTTSTVHDNLFVSRDTGQILSNGVFRDKLTTDMTDIALMQLANVQKKEIVTSIEACFEIFGG